MKVVINTCFGGFGLSIEAEQMIANLKGFKLFFYHQTKFGYKDEIEEYTRIDGKEKFFCKHSMKKDLGKTTSKLPSEDYFSIYDIERNDPDLIKAVEKLKDKASGNCAALRVVEIPDGTDYTIEEYDGNEHIAEAHQTWHE